MRGNKYESRKGINQTKPGKCISKFLMMLLFICIVEPYVSANEIM